MNKLQKIIFSFGLCLFFGSSLALDISQLIKVNKENNPQCVTYYHYKGELYCSTASSGSEKPDPQLLSYETQNIVFDERPWQPVWGKNANSMTTLEYVPAGDDVNNWKELVTSQFASGLQNKVTPLEFSQTIINGLEKAGFKPEITYFEKSPDRVIFEFRILEPKNLMQDELQMITKGKDGLYILHYVIKGPDMGEANRNKWITNLKASKPMK